ncbi:signal transduction histidine kinase/CheY-like chemotaxis protein/HPt (histidine-containing phosphotransfer) domain-containing protein [Bosea sp. OAE506]|uniref:ATP-binding protein n=1 Tax=Bosea sp. OAE506 TaxID=2663870 RepID=UPI001789F5CA
MGQPSNSNRLNNLGILVLVGLSVLLGSVVMTTFSALGTRHRATDESVREDAVWAAYQLDREAKKLAFAVHELTEEPSTALLADVTLRYDILYSRTTLLTNDHFRTKFGRETEILMLAQDARQQILQLAASVDALARESETEASVQASALQGPLTALVQVTERLLNATNLAQSRMRVQDRADTTAAYHQLASAMTALIVSLAMIVVYLGVQLYHIRIARRRFERLSIENADAAKRAEAGARAKSIFLATMSHEIRTPLNGIIGMVDVMRGTQMSGSQRQKLSVIGECSDTLLALIDDILDFSKLESGAVDFEALPFELGDVFATVANVMGARARDKDITLHVEHPPARVTADATRLRQILFNLVGNAVKFTDRGGVRVVGRLDGPWLRVEVEDTGIGIPPEARDRLFQDFSQLDITINRRFGGTGLGLAICRRLIGAMGGDIGVDPREGGGTRFWFTLPVGPVAPSRAAPVTPTEPVADRMFKGRVLVAEDNAINFTVARELLQRFGVEVDHAPDGRIATHLVQSAPYDLVLMDMQMPVMSGLEATQAIRGEGFADLPIVGLTANAFASDREACLAAGMSDFVAKPINRAKIAAILTRWMPDQRPIEDMPPQAAPGTSFGEGKAPAPVDRAVRDELRREIGSDLLDELTRQFWPDATSAIADAAKALLSCDSDTAIRELHTLKGLAGTLGFIAVEASARTAEAAVRTREAADLSDLQATLLRTVLALEAVEPTAALPVEAEAVRRSA